MPFSRQMQIHNNNFTIAIRNRLFLSFFYSYIKFSILIIFSTTLISSLSNCSVNIFFEIYVHGLLNMCTIQYFLLRWQPKHFLFPTCACGRLVPYITFSLFYILNIFFFFFYLLVVCGRDHDTYQVTVLRYINFFI